MQRLSMSKGHAFILVYSTSSRQSFEDLTRIYNELEQIKGSVADIPIMIVGNKCDEPNREVPVADGIIN